MGIFTKTFEKNRYNVREAAQKSRSWFQQQTLLLTRQTPVNVRHLINADSDRNVMKITPGELYLFAYDAKLKETLPYWDMFPLVFPFRKLPDGFIGLNMHYLPYQLRMQLLDRLMDFKTDKSLTESTRLKYTWSTIAGVSRFKNAEPCVHRYLSTHVKSPFKKIDSQYWGTAMMLPVERFTGANKFQVWRQSLK